MDETIGVKGGKNDRRRSLVITKKQYKKLEEHKLEQEKKELEKEENTFKINQVKSVVISVPLIVTGSIFKELVSPKEPSKDSKINLTTEKYSSKKKKQEEKPSKEITSSQEVQSDKVVEVVEQNNIPLPESDIETKFDNIKNREIINYYESKLKEIKLDLKNLIYEYNVIVEDSEEIYESKIAQELLDKLNIIIKKIEDLKRMIDIPNMEDYDQNYIYSLISEYLSEFEKNNLVDEIKDSELYILISSKLQELDEKKDKLSEILTDKKEEINLDEEKLEQLKEKYNTFDNFNNALIRFQADQDSLTRDLEEKMKNATSVTERVEVKFRFLQSQTHAIRDLIAPQLVIPGVKSGVRLAVATASLVHVMRNHIRPRTETTRYRVVNVTDYAKDITNSINDIEKGLSLLKNSKKQLERLLTEFEENYKQYFGKVKECDKLLEDLQEVLESLDEKEEELELLKQTQEKNLENNNVKVNTLRREEKI